MFKYNLVFFSIILLALPACGFIGSYEDWAVYKLNVQVEDEYGKVIESATVRSSHSQHVRTDGYGRAHLKYMTGGLHVITVSAPGKKTEQIKISIPTQQKDNIIISLSPTESPSPPIGEAFVENP